MSSRGRPCRQGRLPQCAGPRPARSSARLGDARSRPGSSPITAAPYFLQSGRIAVQAGLLFAVYRVHDAACRCTRAGHAPALPAWCCPAAGADPPPTEWRFTAMLHHGRLIHAGQAHIHVQHLGSGVHLLHAPGSGCNPNVAVAAVPAWKRFLPVGLMRSPTTVTVGSPQPASRGVHSQLRGVALRTAGASPSKLCFSRRMNSGVVPQQPPSMEIPSCL